MGIWADQAQRMDRLVDKTLGDTILYATNGTTFVPLDGFIIFPDEQIGGFGIDELNSRPQLKIAKELLPAITQTHRLTCVARLGAGTWRPSNKQPASQGRYWLVDIQKA